MRDGYNAVRVCRLAARHTPHSQDSPEVRNMIELRVNGETHQLDVDPQMPLLWALREHVGLTGTKYGCGIGQCGACTVHLNGAAVRSCSLPVSAVAGQEVTTIEGSPRAPTARRAGGAAGLAGARRGAVRLLPVRPDHAGERAADPQPEPDDAAIDAGMSGNICRCATYARIRAPSTTGRRQLACVSGGHEHDMNPIRSRT
jgi:isoquinoline 1-oxidoreductase alpha subunit